MRQYFIDHAVQNVWCNPDQDNQLIFAAHKITPPLGELNRFRLMNRQLSLPQQGKRYHVYQVGQIQPRALGLLAMPEPWVAERWVKFTDAINLNKVLVSIYTAEGVCLPRYNAYYMFSNDRALVFAIEIDAKIPVNYEQDKVYVRLYSNAYFQTSRADQTEDYLFCKGGVAVDMQMILDYQAEVALKRAKPGEVSCYVNGYLVQDLSPLTAVVGDRIEYLYDSSVKHRVTFTVNSLETFSSVLDAKYKYLLHATVTGAQAIDYQDDIDVYVLDQKSTGAYKGLYYHRNNPDSHRMVTHRDYSVVVNYFEYIASALTEKTGQAGLDIRGFKLQVIVRNSGYNRPLIFDNNRVFELYRLEESEIVQAMVGVNSTLDIWKAANLENSAYTALMRTRQLQLDMSQVQAAYGYNSMAKLVGDTPMPTVLISGRQTAKLPLVLQTNSTVYEYDHNGHLLGWHVHTTGSDYKAQSSACRLVEALSGIGKQKPHSVFGSNNLALPQYHNYRVYMCFYDNGIIDNEWTDITGSDNYRVVNNTLVWNNLQYDQFLMVRTDETFLAYDLEITSARGDLFFTLTEIEDRQGGQGEQLHTLPVPMGEMDLFLNGKALIQGLDYRVKFPVVHILNRSHLVSPTTGLQKIHVRYSGFCNTDLTDTVEGDYGFIEHGCLSNNNRYDIRDDKVLRITVDGSVKHRNSIVFSESSSNISVTDPENGKPYQIKDIVVPLKELVGENTYTFRNKARVTDQAVSGYMTLKHPQTQRGELNAIASRYAVVSPFFARIIHDLKTGILSQNNLTRNLTDINVIELCGPYESLLYFDPLNEDNGFDHRYIIIHPHSNEQPVDLGIYQYRFLLRVIKLYGRDLISPSSFITFTA